MIWKGSFTDTSKDKEGKIEIELNFNLKFINIKTTNKLEVSYEEGKRFLKLRRKISRIHI
ncbi:MAG: hypothetical protein AB1410_08395 [Acidobacteriota bacterium]